MFCVELSHVYANEAFGESQKKTFDMLNVIKNDYQIVRKCCLVDNYHASFTDTDNIKKILEQDNNIHIFYERDLVEYAEELFFNKNIRSEKFNQKRVFFIDEIAIFEIENGKIQYYCATLCSIWYLIRLGKIGEKKDFGKAGKLLNILDKKYEKVESKAIGILNSLGYGDVANNIEYIWIEA